MSKLTIGQKLALAEGVLQYKYFAGASFPDDKYPAIWTLFNADVHNNTYTIAFFIPKHKLKNYLFIPREKRGKLYWNKFNPEKKISQAMMLLDGLSKVSGEFWQLTFSPGGNHRLHCEGKSELNYKDSLLGKPYDEYEFAYNEYGNDLCELVVNACLWWLKNQKEA